MVECGDGPRVRYRVLETASIGAISAAETVRAARAIGPARGIGTARASVDRGVASASECGVSATGGAFPLRRGTVAAVRAFPGKWESSPPLTAEVPSELQATASEASVTKGRTRN
jgi:hypothetical protein